MVMSLNKQLEGETVGKLYERLFLFMGLIIAENHFTSINHCEFRYNNSKLHVPMKYLMYITSSVLK